MTPKKIVVPQNQYTAPTFVEDPNFPHRYAYKRSIDIAEADSIGQDYLSFTFNDSKFAFVLCDGVSQSFIGNLGSNILGDSLIHWLWDDRNFHRNEELQENLALYLQNLVPYASDEINNYKLSDDLPAVVLEDLNEKRQTGSESTFICGRIDLASKSLPNGRIFISWLGDSEGRLWKEEENILPYGQYVTSERWSTNLGIVGEKPYIFVNPLERKGEKTAERLVVFSDGIAIAGSKNNILTNAYIASIIKDIHHSPFSDDISYLEVWFDTPPSTEFLSQKSLDPPQVKEIPTSSIAYTWNEIPEASRYEVELSDGANRKRSIVQGTRWMPPLLDDGEYRVKIRGIKGDIPGVWSANKEVQIDNNKSESEEVSNKKLRKHYTLVGLLGLMLVVVFTIAFLRLLFPVRAPLGEPKQATVFTEGVEKTAGITPPQKQPSVTKTKQPIIHTVIVTQMTTVEKQTPTTINKTVLTQTQPVGYSTSPVNCRARPGTNSEISSYLSQGEELTPIGQIVFHSWWYVKTSNIDEPCWVWIGALKITGDISLIPIITPSP